MQDLWQAHYQVYNLVDGIHKVKYKYGHDDKKFETCGIKYKELRVLS